MCGLANGADAETDEQGWTILPFGMWPHSQGLQRFGEVEGYAIAAAFKNASDGIRKFVKGLPVFRGHPDNAAFANIHTDKTEYGQVSDIEVRPGKGLAIRHILSNAGAALVQKFGLDRISPNWAASDTGETKNGKKIYVPTNILSIGLVKNPNIPNLSLANASESMNLKEALLKLLSLANEASDETILAAVTSARARPEAQTLANAHNEVSVLKAEKTDLEKKLADETKRANDGAAVLANARKVEIANHVTTAIKAGKIAAADRPAYTKILEADLSSGVAILANMAEGTIKTRPTKTSAELKKMDEKAREEFANEGGMASDAGMDGNALPNARATERNNLVNAIMGKMPDTANCMGNAKKPKAMQEAARQRPDLFQH